MTIVDFQGLELVIGDTVIFISGPNSLNKGLVTGFKQLSKVLTVIEIVLTHNGNSHTMTAVPFVCAKVAKEKLFHMCMGCTSDSPPLS
jgi:hypothetical protein